MKQDFLRTKNKTTEIELYKELENVFVIIRDKDGERYLGKFNIVDVKKFINQF